MQSYSSKIPSQRSEEEKEEITFSESSNWKQRKQEREEEMSSRCVCWNKALIRENEKGILLDKLNLEIQNILSEKDLQARLAQIKSDLKEYRNSFNQNHLDQVTTISAAILKNLIKNREKDSRVYLLFLDFVKFVLKLVKSQKMVKFLYQTNKAALWLQIIVEIEAKLFSTLPNKVTQRHIFEETGKIILFLTQTSSHLKDFMENKSIFSVISLILKWKFPQLKNLLVDVLTQLTLRCSKGQLFYQKNNILIISKLLMRSFPVEDLNMKISISRLFSVMSNQRRFKALFEKERMNQYDFQTLKEMSLKLQQFKESEEVKKTKDTPPIFSQKQTLQIRRKEFLKNNEENQHSKNDQNNDCQ